MVSGADQIRQTVRRSWGATRERGPVSAASLVRRNSRGRERASECAGLPRLTAAGEKRERVERAREMRARERCERELGASVSVLLCFANIERASPRRWLLSPASPTGGHSSDSFHWTRALPARACSFVPAGFDGMPRTSHGRCLAQS